MEEIIKLLKKQKKTISTMESCTGGYLANVITNIEGASEVFQFGAVTYSNEFKIKMGVNPDIIQKYTVYSMETAMEMSKTISKFSHSNLGVGITGKLNRADSYNKTKENNLVDISIYNKDRDEFVTKKIKVTNLSRSKNKELIVKEIIKELKLILEKK